MHLEVLFSAGIFAIRTVGDPGAQGDGVLGTHGIGVNTPKAALVAAATAGFANDMHIPNGGMFRIGLLSIMLAAGEPAIVLFVGNTFKVLGVMPKEQVSIAPDITSCAIVSRLSKRAQIISSPSPPSHFKTDHITIGL